MNEDERREGLSGVIAQHEKALVAVGEAAITGDRDRTVRAFGGVLASLAGWPGLGRLADAAVQTALGFTAYARVQAAVAKSEREDAMHQDRVAAARVVESMLGEALRVIAGDVSSLREELARLPPSMKGEPERDVRQAIQAPVLVIERIRATGGATGLAVDGVVDSPTRVTEASAEGSGSIAVKLGRRPD